MTDRRIADIAVRIFRIRVRSAEWMTSGGRSARVQVRTDETALARSAQEAARELVARATGTGPTWRVPVRAG
jgi:hypothetical protein